MHSQGKQLCQISFGCLLKGVYSKRKGFAPCGSKFFPCRVDHFQKDLDLQESKQEVTKNCLPYNKWQRLYHVY